MRPPGIGMDATG